MPTAPLHRRSLACYMAPEARFECLAAKRAVAVCMIKNGRIHVEGRRRMGLQQTEGGNCQRKLVGTSEIR